MSDHDGQYIDYGPKDSGTIDISKGKTQIVKESRHEYKTVPVLQYEAPRGDGKGLANACESLEREGWEVMSASAVESSAHWNTTSFVVVARRLKQQAGVTDHQADYFAKGREIGVSDGGVFCSGCMALYSRTHELWCPVARCTSQLHFWHEELQTCQCGRTGTGSRLDRKGGNRG